MYINCLQPSVPIGRGKKEKKKEPTVFTIFSPGKVGRASLLEWKNGSR